MHVIMGLCRAKEKRGKGRGNQKQPEVDVVIIAHQGSKLQSLNLGRLLHVGI